MSKHLWSALKAHPVGPFQPKLISFEANEPIQFLGHKLALKKTVWITPSDYNLKKFEWEVESELKRLKKPNIQPDVRQRRFKRLEAKVRSWTRGAFKLCDGIEEVNEYWVGQLKKVAPKSKPLWMG